MNRREPIQSRPHRALPRITVMTLATTRPLTGGDDTKEVTPDAAHRTG